MHPLTSLCRWGMERTPFAPLVSQSWSHPWGLSHVCVCGDVVSGRDTLSFTQGERDHTCPIRTCVIQWSLRSSGSSHLNKRLLGLHFGRELISRGKFLSFSDIKSLRCICPMYVCVCACACVTVNYKLVSTLRGKTFRTDHWSKNMDTITNTVCEPVRT